MSVYHIRTLRYMHIGYFDDYKAVRIVNGMDWISWWTGKRWEKGKKTNFIIIVIVIILIKWSYIFLIKKLLFESSTTQL